MSQLAVSVVVCTHNPRRDLLFRTLDSIASQDLRPGDEVMLIDNASAPSVATLDGIEVFGLRIEREERLGLTAAREAATRAARGAVLIFVDDDNVLAPDYVAVARDLFESEGLGVVSGEVVPEYEVPAPRWLASCESALAIRRPQSDQLTCATTLYSELFPIGAGMCVRRQVLAAFFSGTELRDRIQGRQGTQLCGGEDLDIDCFALSQGWRIGVTRRLRVTHLIASHRVSEEYIVALMRGALLSASYVNAKWRPIFGADVVPFFGRTRAAVCLRLFGLWPLRFATRFRIRYLLNKCLLDLLA